MTQKRSKPKIDRTMPMVHPNAAAIDVGATMHMAAVRADRTPSGGKVLSSRTRRGGSRAAALLRLAAVTVGRTDTALGAFYRRLSARIGKAKAVTATARKIAVLFYNAVRCGMDYVDPGASSYETRYRTRVVNNLHRRAKAFGFVLQPLEPNVGAAVS